MQVCQTYDLYRNGFLILRSHLAVLIIRQIYHTR